MSIANMFGYVSLDTFIRNVKGDILARFSWEPYHPKNTFHEIFGLNGVSYHDCQQEQYLGRKSQSLIRVSVVNSAR